MSRDTDENNEMHFQMDRFIQQDEEWYYTTREGEERGPFATKDDAHRDLAAFLKKLEK